MNIRKLLLRVGIALLGLIVIAMVAALVIVQTDWFREYVRRKVIVATEEGTGGRVEIGSFGFSPRRFEAVVTDFVLHGKEPVGSAPFVRVARVQVNIRLFTSIRRLLDISYLGVEQPQANIMVFADGTTNLPEPKKQTESNTTTLDTVIELAVDRFLISRGLLTFNSQPQALNIRGNNLHALLRFNPVVRSYRGDISLQPIYVVSGRNTPVEFTVTLPLVLEQKRIVLENAKIATPASGLIVNGSIEDLKNPRIDTRINGHLALADIEKLADLSFDANARKTIPTISVDGRASVAAGRIAVDSLHLAAGRSSIEASGALKDPQGNQALDFRASVALDEIGRVARLSARPAGALVANGRAKLDAANKYQVTAEIEGRGLSFVQDGQRLQNINLHSSVDLNPSRVNLKGLRLSALGGEFTGDASLEEFARYSVSGTLRGFNLQNAMNALGQKPLSYDGSISGPVEARGDLKSVESKLAEASAKLTIAPGKRGIPMSGRLNAQYNGASDNISLRDSYIALPNTRLNVAGSLNNRLDVDLTSRNLNELLASAGPNVPAIKLDGQARLTGQIMGSLAAPRITGKLAVTQFSIEGRRFDYLASDLSASKTGAAIANGLLQRGPMRTQFDAAVGLDNWSPKANQPVRANVNVRNGDIADVMAVAGQSPAGYGGALSVTAAIGGSIGNPTGSADLVALNGTIQEQPFDRIEARVNLADRLITLPNATVVAGPSQIRLSAEFQHPRDALNTGQLHAHVQISQFDLEQVRILQQQRPNTAGTIAMNADIRGRLDRGEFLLSSVQADASARKLRLDGQNYGNTTLNATTDAGTVRYNVVSDFAGSDIRVDGNTQLAKDYPTTADVRLRNLPMERVLAAARRPDIPARGILSGSAHVAGTLADPRGNADLEIIRAVIEDEPIDRVNARVAYEPGRIDLSILEIAAGPARLELSARFDHPPNNLDTGNLEFKTNITRVDLARIRSVQKVRPGIGGVLQIAASGNGKVQPGSPRILFRDLSADLSANGISSGGTNLGDLTFKATTTDGRLNFALDSNLANASINGKGTAELAGSYPVDVQLSFRNVTWTHLQPLIATPGANSDFEALVDGQLHLQGPTLNTIELRGSLTIPTLEVNTLARPGSSSRPVAVRNAQPIVATLDRGTVRIGSFHLTGPQTDIRVTGAVGLVEAQPMNVRVAANADIGLLESIDRDVFASGKIVLAVSVTGTRAKPLISGTLDLQNASINHVDLPNGLSNANGQMVFTGSTVTIRNLTAESGGGKIVLAGFVGYSGGLRMGIRASATNIRIRSEQGVSIVITAAVNITGTVNAGFASGAVTINRVTYAPRSDFGAMLTRAAPPVQAAGPSNPFLDHLRLDVRVRTSSATAVQASLAENLQLDGDLRVRGTATRPSVLGRIVIARGDLVFFGSKYHVSNGNIGFFDPMRIEPVLDLSLETQAKGVNVVLNVSGPVDNMKLSYTSEPPLQFQEIVALLASGKTPTSDPTLLANQPSQPQQSFQQMGESAIVSKAFADPVASRLERVFGVSQLKIDPTFTSGSDLPQARVTLQQQVASSLTFTYVTVLENPNTQIIRIDWAFSPSWSAVASRDENGSVSINLLYKKQFR